MTVSRTAVLWLGEAARPTFEGLLVARRLALIQGDAPTDAELQGAKAAVFSARGGSAKSLIALLEDRASACLAHGLMVVVSTGSPAHAMIQTHFGAASERWIFSDPAVRTDEELAELIRDFDPKSAENAALVVPNVAPPLSDEDKLLLRRAFTDCETLTLLELNDGKSSARVFRAHAKLALHDPPGFLLPFLVKIDDTVKIDVEIDRYQRFVGGHIPFTQRPNLDVSRCIRGDRRQVMVSDFVEDAVPLSAICDRPDGRRIIYSLFDDALRSWRRHAFLEPTSPVMAITAHLGDVAQPAAIPADVLAKAKAAGLKATPQQLYDELTLYSSRAWKLGIIHGDLHPGNVMVRGQEAILIDFASIWDEKKPLVADLACLEIAMCFTVATDRCARSSKRMNAKAFRAWKAVIDQLFKGDALRQVPPLQEPGTYDWLWDACRQTRIMAAQLESSQAAYACSLVLYLLRRARLGGAPRENPSIGGYALRTAERVIGHLKRGEI